MHILHWSALAVVLAGAACVRVAPDGVDGGGILFDSGAPPVACGNGLVEAGEECEPPGTATCDMTCQTIPPPPPMCGNSILEVGEMCDPPNMTTCAADCTLIATGSVAVGGPCTLDAECMGGVPGGMARCIDEVGFGWPGGYCLVEGCDPGDANAMPPIPDNCPTGSACRGLGDGMGGVVNYCLEACTPSATSNGGCRTDTGTDFAYACTPDLVTSGEGYCFLGCETDVACNGCDEMAGTCFNDGLACAVDADCTLIDDCHTTINLCVPGHPGNPGASIGDACMADADCPQYSFCAGATGTSTVYPGGYCFQVYCASFPTLPEFQCAMGGTCPALSDFLGMPGLLNFCAASCLVDTAAPGSTCDSDRGTTDDYECMETGVPAGIMFIDELFDNDGAPGFCFQCEALFMTGCP